MRRIVLLLGCLAAISSGAQAGELFRWVDAQGKVHYGDAPPPGASQVTPLKMPAATEPVDDLPYEVRRAQQNFPVTLYVADNCTSPCDKARDLLNQRGTPYNEKKLATQQDIDTFKALSGFDSVPALAVGRTFLKGFLAEQWHGELDMAGYPRSSSYRRPVVRPSTLPASAPAATDEAAPTGPPATNQAAPTTPPAP